MTELVGNCPRCKAQEITFGLTQDNLIEKWSGLEGMTAGTWEAFCVCLRCYRATIFVLRQKDPDRGSLVSNGLQSLSVVNDKVVIRSYINVTNFKKSPSPEHLPDPVAAAFQEGATCVAVGCFNAAAAMFRLSLDLATKDLLPCKAVEDLDDRTRRFLARRLTWLFDNKKLPEVLRELSSVVKDEGNTGAHDGTIDEAAAEDLIDFTERLLTHLYTEPEKLRLAQERMVQREAQRTHGGLEDAP